MGKPRPVCALACLLFLWVQGMLMAKVEATSSVHIVYLGGKQHDDPILTTNSHHDMLASVVGSKEMAAELMVYSYKHGFSGFAAKLTESQAQKLSELPGVIRVIPNSLHRLQTTRSWDFLGLPSHSPVNILHNSSMGDGVIIGVLDTGIWPESKGFQKIIGARWFVDGFLAEYGQPLNTSENSEFLSPRDANGHGTHTASTAAGNFVDNVSYRGLGLGTIRGGAPRAQLAIYKVCWNVLGGQCSSADILKAFDEAIHDGVDVLSLSIGSSIPLFSDIDERDGIATGSFHAVAKGITVVCGAANDGPSAQTVQNTAPWILTVAASSMDRAFPTPITLGNNKTFQGKGLYSGNDTGFRSLFYPEAEGLDPNLFRGGAGLIVAKNPSESLYPCTDGFPCIEIDYEIGTQILFYIRSTRSPVVAHFSSRGPNSIAPAILKPDVAAPGVNILAATSPLGRFQEGGYAMLSGTSMATPHVSGIVALLKAVHPDWSPAAIKSSIVTTAWRNNPSGFPLFAEGSPPKLADTFDYGGGIVNPNGAANPGLVYDMGKEDYINYLCAMNYNSTAISRLTGNLTVCPIEEPSILNINLPSITIPNLRNSITLTRTVTNVGATNSIYRVMIEPPFGTSVSVKPNVLVFNHGTKKITFTVTVTTAHQVNTEFSFGSLTWTDGVHIVRSPLSVRAEFLQPYF
ncbi:hypothetical protein OIU84_003249 [Salix udensis]|uniref:Uncharacterized protein n=1 Tax=Salix udensis TaxID=889485 RepID=A0AAD6K859_9ROSI|nr:hypothetical protein OIU84_003249 [Salix udensis]